MLDIVNRFRNLLGNYRFVSYRMRLWELEGRIGIGAGIAEESLEKKLMTKQLRRYHNPRPWSTLDLGSGSQPRNPFGAERVSGCDIREDLGRNVTRSNLVLEGIPFDRETVDFVTAYNFIEHVPRLLAIERDTCFPFVELMSEIYRVLKPGGIFYAKTPAWPSEEAFQDPTHVNIITDNTLPYYFCWHPYGGPWAHIYGFKGRFELLMQRRAGPYLLSALRKI